MPDTSSQIDPPGEGGAGQAEAAGDGHKKAEDWPVVVELFPAALVQLSSSLVAQMESKEPVNLPLGWLKLLVQMEGEDQVGLGIGLPQPVPKVFRRNLLRTLERCRALPAIRRCASQWGFCGPGEFTEAVVTAIIDLLCEKKGIDQLTAEAMLTDDVAEFLLSEVGDEKGVTPKRKPKKRGRPADTNPKADKKISDAWDTGAYKTEADLARELEIKEREVTLARDRHRKRLKRAEKKRRTNSPDE